MGTWKVIKAMVAAGVAKLPMPMTRRRGMAARSLLVIIEGCVFACGAYADAVTDWNAIAFNTIPPSVVGPSQARVLGYVHAAIFDAVNAVEPKYTVYAVDVNARGASAEAAAAADQFAVSGPLSVQSGGYAKDIEEVRVLGARNSSQRTSEQTARAIFWTVSMPNVMNDIARSQATTKGNDLAANARLFALLNMAASDSQVATWALKFKHNFLRPVTAIRNALALDNPRIQQDAEWEPLIVSPGHPDYPPGHCAYAGAATAILRKFFDTDTIENASYTYPLFGVTCYWSSYSALAKDVIDARVWGGIHTRTADEHAYNLGLQIAEYEFNNFMRPLR